MRRGFVLVTLVAGFALAQSPGDAPPTTSGPEKAPPPPTPSLSEKAAEVPDPEKLRLSTEALAKMRQILKVKEILAQLKEKLASPNAQPVAA